MSATPTQSLATTPACAPPQQEPTDWFAILLTMGVFVSFWYCLWERLLTESNITLILGGMLTWIMTRVNYLWGSSSGSKAKDAAIANLNKP